MAGSDYDDEELVAGRGNWAQSITSILAGSHPNGFHGLSVLEVKVGSEPPSRYGAGDEFRPRNAVRGIVGEGWAGLSYEYGSLTGASNPDLQVGVAGFGGLSQGTGVLGVGGGHFSNRYINDLDDSSKMLGDGGIGVHGRGGSVKNVAPRQIDPGVGVIGHGGRESSRYNTLRRPHAAGVVGISGATHLQESPSGDIDELSVVTSKDSGGVGVFGQGSAKRVENILNQPSGPQFPGSGVVGRGGRDRDDAEHGSGVVGLSGVKVAPDVSELNSAGVVGASRSGRGGIFSSEENAQLHLMPRKSQSEIISSGPPLPMPRVVGSPILGLPRNGTAGDFCSLVDANSGNCVLWFCIKSPGPNADGIQTDALWSQVLLDNPIFGDS